MLKEITIYFNLLYFRADTGYFSAELQQHFLKILLVMLQLVMGIIIIFEKAYWDFPGIPVG
jgi:hypothetical protein